MLPKTKRLSGADVRVLLAKGRRTHTLHFTIIASPLPRGASGGSRFAVVVSSRVLDSAVSRNALRRRVYAALFLTGSSKNSPPAIFIAKRGVETLRGEPLARAVSEALRTISSS